MLCSPAIQHLTKKVAPLIRITQRDISSHKKQGNTLHHSTRNVYLYRKPYSDSSSFLPMRVKSHPSPSAPKGHLSWARTPAIQTVFLLITTLWKWLMSSPTWVSSSQAICPQMQNSTSSSLKQQQRQPVRKMYLGQRTPSCKQKTNRERAYIG